MAKDVHNLQEVEDSEQETEEESDQEEGEDDMSLFVYSLESSCAREDEQFYEVVEVEDTQVRFQLDSGAKGNVMSLKTYSNLQRHPLPLLKKTHAVLVSFSKYKLKPRGEVVLEHKIPR